MLQNETTESQLFSHVIVSAQSAMSETVTEILLSCPREGKVWFLYNLIFLFNFTVVSMPASSIPPHNPVVFPVSQTQFCMELGFLDNCPDPQQSHFSPLSFQYVRSAHKSH